jgi:hypothetical protein
MKWIFLLLFGVIGLVMFSVGVGWGWKRYGLLKEGVRVSGTVIEIEESVSTTTKDGRQITSISYYPVVEFSAHDGRKYKLKGSTGEGSSSYFVGSEVDVIYRKSRPQEAQIADFSQFWLGPLGVGLFGFVFLVAGIGAFFLIGESDKNLPR